MEREAIIVGGAGIAPLRLSPHIAELQRFILLPMSDRTGQRPTLAGLLVGRR
jgi:hypothetical protein